MARSKKHETFLYRVYKKVMPTVNGCIEFYGCKNDDGYGRINKNGKLVFIHRQIYEEMIGKIPEKMCVCHKCDNPSCINHAHLFLGTHKDNMSDRASKGRYNNIGQNAPSSKLKDNDVFEIRKRIKVGETCYSIARSYKVKGETILAIKNKRTWAHLK